MSAHEFMAGRTAPLRLVIFDCDGVLADSEPLANRVTAEMISREGWPITAAEAEARFVGLNLEAMVPVIEKELGRPLAADWVERLTTRLIEVFGRGGQLKSSWYGDCLPSRDFPMLIELYLQGRLDLDRFVSETIKLEDVEAAFHKMEKGDVLRSVVVM